MSFITNEILFPLTPAVPSGKEEEDNITEVVSPIIKKVESFSGYSKTTLTNANRTIQCIAFNGKYLAWSDEPKCVHLYKLDTDSTIQLEFSTPSAVAQLATSNDSLYIADEEGYISVLQLSDLTAAPAVFMGGQFGLKFLQVDPEYLAVGRNSTSREKLIEEARTEKQTFVYTRCYRNKSRKPTLATYEHSCDLAPRYETITTPAMIQVFKTDSAESVLQIPFLKPEALLLHDSSLFVSLYDTSAVHPQVCRWDLKTGTLSLIALSFLEQPIALACHKNTLAIGTERVLKLWDTDEEKCIEQIKVTGTTSLQLTDDYLFVGTATGLQQFGTRAWLSQQATEGKERLDSLVAANELIAGIENANRLAVWKLGKTLLPPVSRLLAEPEEQPPPKKARLGVPPTI